MILGERVSAEPASNAAIRSTPFRQVFAKGRVGFVPSRVRVHGTGGSPMAGNSRGLPMFASNVVAHSKTCRACAESTVQTVATVSPRFNGGAQRPSKWNCTRHWRRWAFPTRRNGESADGSSMPFCLRPARSSRLKATFIIAIPRSTPMGPTAQRKCGMLRVTSAGSVTSRLQAIASSCCGSATFGSLASVI